MKEYIFDVTPVAKPRMTQRDKWLKPARPVVSRYWAYADTLRWLALKNGYPALDILDAIFIIPFPKSYSRKKRESLNGRPHQIRPDIKNIVAGVEDILWSEDSIIWKHHTEKRWGHEGKIILRA